MVASLKEQTDEKWNFVKWIYSKYYIVNIMRLQNAKKRYNEIIIVYNIINLKILKT